MTVISRKQLEEWNNGPVFDLQTPYREGQQDYAQERLRSSCKYDEPCLKAWQDGWDDAASEASFIRSTNRFVQ